jgi:hypothetical protein
MAVKDRSAWSSWVADMSVRYLWRPRHSQDEPRRLNWITVAGVLAAVLAIGAATYAVFRDDGDEQAQAGVTLPTPALMAPGDYASVPVYVAPASPSPSFSPAPAPSRTPAPSLSPTSRRPSTPAAPTTPAWSERVIAATSVLSTGQSWSTNRLGLTVTTGGNLVLQDQGRTVWQTGTTTGVKLVMQNDGHLVLYDAGDGTAFSSGTAGNPGAVLVLRADGNMVISLNGRVLFQTGTGD